MKPRQSVSFSWAVALLLLGLTPAVVLDAQHVLPLEKVAKDARVILVAKALSVDVRREGNIYTFVDFQNVQLIKGSVAPRFTYRMLGGRVDDVEVSSDPPNPTFTPGQEYVLFLGQQSSVEGYPTLYMDNVYNIVTVGGVKSVTRMDTIQPGRRGTVVPLTDFLEAVRKAL